MPFISDEQLARVQVGLPALTQRAEKARRDPGVLAPVAPLAPDEGALSMTPETRELAVAAFDLFRRLA